MKHGNSARARWEVILHFTELSSGMAAARSTLADAEATVQLAEVVSGPVNGSGRLKTNSMRPVLSAARSEPSTP
jgi:hypothetical protein